MSGSGYTCVRYVFCYINVLLWLSGCGILGIGLWLKLESAQEKYGNLLSHSSSMGLDIVLIVIGASMVTITFFACCGSWFQNRCMLITYFSLVILMFLIEFAFATCIFVYREDITFTLKEGLLEGIEKDFEDPGVKEMWTTVQTELECCGVNSFEDWYNISSWPDKKMVPSSCCQAKYRNSTRDCGGEGKQDLWFQDGCSDKLQMWLVNQLHIVGIIGLIISFKQLFGLISAMLLFCTVRHKRAKGHIYKAYGT